MRLDSRGIRRIRERIPANHNPFSYYDKTIISIDTLKRGAEYRTYIEDAQWDIVVVDEAQNAAKRGSTPSQRHKLVDMLSRQCDTMIMLSATPHDGTPESFASLMNMLDPTAIANPSDYSREDIEGLFIRRFKGDIKDQVDTAFLDRDVAVCDTESSAAEESVYELLAELDLATLDEDQRGGFLFKTTLEKALFSSPAACLETVTNRIDRLQRDAESDHRHDLKQLTELRDALQQVDARQFSKYQALVSLLSDPDTGLGWTGTDADDRLVIFSERLETLRFLKTHLTDDLDLPPEAVQTLHGGMSDVKQLTELRDALQQVDASQFSKYQELVRLLGDPDAGLGWTGTDADDRLVIFSERLETLRFLKTHLTADLDLPPEAVQTLHGGMSDVEQQEIVEAFGQDKADVRVLLASDIAAEGINLHYLSHRLIHFDIPWSLMIFQQRNGRIDRYGQDQRPQIRYMATKPAHPKIRGDLRILEVLIRKEEQAESNIDDPAALMGVYDVEKEQQRTGQAMESGETDEEFERELEANVAEESVMDMLLAGEDDDASPSPQDRVADPVSLFDSEFDYLQTALNYFNTAQGMELDIDTYPSRETVRLTATDSIKARFERLPDNAFPSDRVFLLSSDPEEVQDSIRAGRQASTAWPDVQYLWKLHPVMQWVDDTVASRFHRNEAPVLTLPPLPAGERMIICSGNIPNRRGQPVVNEWVGVVFADGVITDRLSFEEVINRARLDTQLANAAPDLDTGALETLLPDAIEAAEQHMLARREEVENKLNEQLQTQLDRLEDLRRRHKRQIEIEFDASDRPEGIVKGEKEKRRRAIKRIFDDFYDWVEDTMTTEKSADIQVVAALTSTQTG
ncbi:MAG: helicase-related protein [Longimonas sp.]|uniref:helicase-related protein n=1 Tax=Longimonas sp. TaxID=2039626 RepID=UPI0039768A76